MMPSISTLNRWARLKSPWVLVLPIRLWRVHFTAMLLLQGFGPHRGPGSLRSGPWVRFLTAHPCRRPPLESPGPRDRALGLPPPSFELLGLPCHLADAEDDELGRLHRSDADLADHLAGIDYFRRVGLGIALDVERLLRRLAHQRARVVDAQQEGGDVPGDPLPERLVVGLEDHPLRADLDRLLDHQEQAADVDVPPRRVAGDRARAPDPDATVAHVPDAVDPARVQEVLLRARDGVLETERAANDLVRGGLVHAALSVAARIDAGHVARGRNEDVPLLGVVHLDPGEVVRRVLRVARLGHLCDAILAQLLRRVEDRETVLVVLAVRDHRILDRGVRLARRADQGDLRDVVEDVQARAASGALVLADVQRRAGGRGCRDCRGCGGRSGLAAFASLLRLRF